jgi:hypothetical protein
MRNIILQHYTGNLGELEKLSIANMSKYAERIGAQYKFIQGDVFRKNMSPPCQKMYMLDPIWDEYDYVAMADIDMFAVNNLEENLFTDISGVGLFYETTARVFENCQRMHPNLCDKNYAYWGGCLWRLSKDLRKTLRQYIKEEEIWRFNKNFEDEGIMHRLAVHAKIKPDPFPQRWSYCSYLPNPEKAAIIHVRTKITPTGPKRTKLENYTALKQKGIIE